MGNKQTNPFGYMEVQFRCISFYFIRRINKKTITKGKKRIKTTGKKKYKVNKNNNMGNKQTNTFALTEVQMYFFLKLPDLDSILVVDAEPDGLHVLGQQRVLVVQG